MPSITKLAGRIAKSPTIAMNDKAKQLAAEGHSVIGLAGGEPDFDTPAHIVEAAMKAIRDGETRYAAPSKGIAPLLEAIAAKMERDNNVRVDPMSDIIVTPGGKLALFLALKAMLDPGDEVLIPAPYWVSYPSIVTMVGGVPVTVPTSSDDGYRLRLEDLREFVTPKTKAIIITPLAIQPGTCCRRTRLKKLLRWRRKPISTSFPTKYTKSSTSTVARLFRWPPLPISAIEW